MTAVTPRYPVLTPETMNPEQREAAQEIASGPRGAVLGPFIPLLHNPALARRVQAVGEHLRYGTQLPAALTELAVLVAARHWSCQHEWYAHEKIARKAGLADAIIGAIAEGRQPEGMTSDETIVYRFCRQTHRDGKPDDAAFGAARDRFGLDGTLDLLALCGYYAMLAMVLNTAGMSLPDGAQPPLRAIAGEGA